MRGVETHEMDILERHTRSIAGSLQSVATGNEINEAQSVVSQVEGATSIFPCYLIQRRLFCSVTCLIGLVGSYVFGLNIDQSCRSDGDNDRLRQAEAQTRAYFLMIVERSQSLMDTKSAAASNPTGDSGPSNTISDPESDQQPEESEEPRMIGDFDGSASEFWKLFRDEAKSHDDAQINTLKEGMDSALIFVRSYSLCAITDLVVLMCRITGWFVFCCSHSVRGR